MHRYFATYKPYDMLSQFSREGSKVTLADLPYDFARDIYPVGRLDQDSEGLLILSNDVKLNKELLDPLYSHQRTYLVQVENIPTSEALQKLEKGNIPIRVKDKIYHTRPCRASLLVETPILPERNPPIRFRKDIPTAWLKLTLTEGKNRQVRKMTAAVGFPTLRLVRYSLGSYTIDGFKSGEVRELGKEELRRVLNA